MFDGRHRVDVELCVVNRKNGVMGGAGKVAETTNPTIAEREADEEDHERSLRICG